MMKAILLPIFGPIAINSYGFFVALGVISALFFIKRHPLFGRLRLDDHFEFIVFVITITAFIGARTLYVLSEQYEQISLIDFFAFWQGGFSILGAIIGALMGSALYLRYLNIPVLSFFDMVSIHAGLLQGIARIGCFYAGCCYGKLSDNFFAVQYTDINSSAPLHIFLHPAQLYSSCALISIFLCMYFIVQYYFKKPGQCTFIYLMLISLERFMNDLIRADRLMVTDLLSYHQFVAIFLFTLSMIGLIVSTIYSKNSEICHQTSFQ